MSRLVTRVAPGVVVSTIQDGDKAQTVTFVADPTTRSGCNVAGVVYGPLSRLREQHQTERVVALVVHGGAR